MSVRLRSLLNQVQSWLSRRQASRTEQQSDSLPEDLADTIAHDLERLQWPEIYYTTLQNKLASTIQQWQADPDDEPNHLVVLSSPVNSPAELLNTLASEYTQFNVVYPLPSKRLTQLSNQASQLRRILEDQAEQQKSMPRGDGKPDENEKNGADDPDADSSQSAQPILMVIPELHQNFLRSIGGWQELIEVRDAVVQYPHVFWLIGCNTWAWEFLDRVCQIRAYFDCCTSLPDLSGKDLQNWLSAIATHLLEPDCDDLNVPTFESDSYWKGLADLSRGGSRAAAQLWLKSLRIRTTDKTTEPPHDPTHPTTHSPSSPPTDSSPTDHPSTHPPIHPSTSSPSTQIPTYWANKLHQTHPVLPSLPSITMKDRYLLHSLLLHGAMTRSHLALSLGETESILRSQAQLLLRQGVLEQHQGQLAVSPKHYPRLKTELADNNFLVGET
ncbi:MAG: hypothetical protein ACTS2F_16000 [Thainema sp.]